MTSVAPSESAAWDAFVAAHPAAHILQTAEWGALKAAFGWRAERASLQGPQCGAPKAGALLLFRRFPWGQTVAYAPRGPLVDWSDPAEVRGMVAEMAAVARRGSAALLKIEPELEAGDPAEALLPELGFVRSAQRVQPVSTIHLDLSADDETLLGRMKPKWRYNIRLAERKGVTVREAGPSDLLAIQRLLDVTGGRDGFGVHNAEYNRRAAELFMPGMAAWLLAEHEGALLAAIAVFALGKMGWYMWGASDDAGRNLMPNHALQWAGMHWAQARGAQVYDLWGIPDEVGDDPAMYAEPESWGQGGLWGVYRFKQGFGGRVVRYTGTWDLPLSRIGFALYGLGLKARARASAGGGEATAGGAG
jgi:lipid II:glycine glycyltransferase (peptidoglycan interpeptide bridge formation enzyme)